MYRRICLLRAQDRPGPADELEHGEFARVLARARLSAPEAVDESALRMEESTRVADAAVLAELLAPLLAARLSPGQPLPPAVAAAETEPPPTRSNSNPPGSVTVPGIADLIEGMLEQEHSRRRR